MSGTEGCGAWRPFCLAGCVVGAIGRAVRTRNEAARATQKLALLNAIDVYCYRSAEIHYSDN